MLARAAEGLYWMGRYLERTEHLCRLLRDQVEALVDRPVREIDFGWRRIYASLGRRPPGPEVGFTGDDDDYTLADAYVLADDLTFERTNPDAIRSGFARGRDNARQVRHAISAEMWTSLNAAWLRLEARSIEEIWKTAPESFYAEVARGLDTFAGAAETTMYRDQGWRFLQIGRFTERAQLTIALLLAHRASVRPRDEPAAEDDWTSLLRVCQAFDAYTRRYGVEVRADRALDLLVSDPLLPRSLCRTLDRAAAELAALPAGPGPAAEARRLAGELAAAGRESPVDRRSPDDHAARLRRLLDRCRELHGLVVAAYVEYDLDAAPLL